MKKVPLCPRCGERDMVKPSWYWRPKDEQTERPDFYFCERCVGNVLGLTEVTKGEAKLLGLASPSPEIP